MSFLSNKGAGRGRWAQLVRKLIQLSVFAFIVYSAFGTGWRNLKLAHNNARLVGLLHGEMWSDLYAANEKLLRWWGGEETFASSLDFLGMPWAATIFGLPTADPLLVAGSFVATGTVQPAMLWALIVPFGLALLFGKVFCSYLCPMRFAFDIGQLVRAGLLLVGISLPVVRMPVRLGGWVLLGGLFATAGAGMAVWLYILPYVSLGAGIFLLVTAQVTGGLLTVALFWVVMDCLVAPGQFCHAVCPTGWLLEQMGRWRVWGLRRKDKTDCATGCQSCVRACPYTLSPKKMTMTLPDCNSCGQCVVACPDRKLSRGFHLPLQSVKHLSGKHLHIDKESVG